MAQNTQNDWLSPTGLEAEYEIKKSTQAKYRMEAKIPFCKIGKFIRYNRAEINAWIASHKMGVTLWVTTLKGQSLEDFWEIY